MADHFGGIVEHEQPLDLIIDVLDNLPGERGTPRALVHRERGPSARLLHRAALFSATHADEPFAEPPLPDVLQRPRHAVRPLVDRSTAAAFRDKFVPGVLAADHQHLAAAAARTHASTGHRAGRQAAANNLCSTHRPTPAPGKRLALCRTGGGQTSGASRLCTAGRTARPAWWYRRRAPTRAGRLRAAGKMRASRGGRGHQLGLKTTARAPPAGGSRTRKDHSDLRVCLGAQPLAQLVGQVLWQFEKDVALAVVRRLVDLVAGGHDAAAATAPRLAGARRSASGASVVAGGRRRRPGGPAQPAGAAADRRRHCDVGRRA